MVIFFRLHIYSFSKWLSTHTHTVTARVSSHVHSTCTSYVLYAYLYCVYALVGGAISIRDLYICAVHESVPTNRTLSSIDPLSVQYIGFKTSIEAYFVDKTVLRRQSCSRLANYTITFERIKKKKKSPF